MDGMGEDIDVNCFEEKLHFTPKKNKKLSPTEIPP